LTLYARLTLALMGAAAGGATALVMTATADVAPAVTWGMLLGTMLAMAATLARWVMRPLRRLVADMEEGEPPPVDRTLAHLRKAFLNLRGRLSERETQVEVQVSERVRDLVTGHAALSLLFDAVAGDDPDEPDADFANTLLSRWVREGPVRGAGVWWSDGAPAAFLSAGEAPLRPDQVPDGLLAAADGATHPVVESAGSFHWLAVAVPAFEEAPGRPARRPRALVAAWPAAHPPADTERVACTALARYLAVRSTAHAARSVPLRPGPAPETAPEATPQAAPETAPVAARRDEDPE
jgi:hypothetical protein